MESIAISSSANVPVSKMVQIIWNRGLFHFLYNKDQSTSRGLEIFCIDLRFEAQMLFLTDLIQSPTVEDALLGQLQDSRIAAR